MRHEKKIFKPWYRDAGKIVHIKQASLRLRLCMRSCRIRQDFFVGGGGHASESADHG